MRSHLAAVESCVHDQELKERARESEHAQKENARLAQLEAQQLQVRTSLAVLAQDCKYGPLYLLY